MTAEELRRERERLEAMTIDELGDVLLDTYGGFTIHTTEYDPGAARHFCVHPGHDENKGYRGATLRDALLASCFEGVEPSASTGHDGG